MEKTIAGFCRVLIVFMVVSFNLPGLAQACQTCPTCYVWSTSQNKCVCKADGTSCGSSGCKECRSCSCVYKSGNNCETDAQCADCRKCIDCKCEVCDECCNGSCCDGRCCNDECKQGCTGYCCDDSSNNCCNVDEACCLDKCCDNRLRDPCEIYGPHIPAEECCNGACCNNHKQEPDDPFSPPIEHCCNDIPGEGNGYCCPTGYECCEGDCCDPALCETCGVDGECEVCFGLTTEVCCDGTCEPECAEMITANCNQIDDTPCPPCFNWFWQCNNHETEIPLNAPIYTCVDGCPGDPCDIFNPPDCDWEKIDCIKKHECMGLPDYVAHCGWDPVVGRERCIGELVSGWTCYECEPNPDKVDIGWTLSKRCK